jgi:hypothetical protein
MFNDFIDDLKGVILVVGLGIVGFIVVTAFF